MNSKSEQKVERRRKMEEENIVILHGRRTSPYVQRVEMALKLKGIPYEYFEEDLKNKSPLLVKFNPVYKKIPVLVHNEKPLAESLVILEYIDETWKTGPQLLPQDPYKRAQDRFWVSFLQQQLFETMTLVIKTNGEAQQKAIKEVNDRLKLLEGGVKDFFSDGIPSVESMKVGLLDIVMFSVFGAYEAQEQVLGIKLIDPEKTPLVYSWITALIELPVVKEMQIPQEKMVALVKFFRENALKASIT